METLKLQNLATELIQSPSGIMLDFAEESSAIAALKSYELYFAAWARAYQSPYLQVRVSGKVYRQISRDLTPEIFGLSALPPLDEDEPVIQQPSKPNWDLLGADYQRIHEFLIEARNEGLIVAITEQESDICQHTNDLLTPARANVHGYQMTGYNYRQSWKRDFNSTVDDLNPQLERLKTALERDGYVPSYEYTLFRPKDNAKVGYETDFYYCRDYCGTAVRIGVSRPDAYQILSMA